MLNRWVLRRDQKTAAEGAEVTRSGRLFQTRAAATGKARSPTVDSRARLTISECHCTLVAAWCLLDFKSVTKVIYIVQLSRMSHCGSNTEPLTTFRKQLKTLFIFKRHSLNILNKQDTCSKEHRVCPMPRSLITTNIIISYYVCMQKY